MALLVNGRGIVNGYQIGPGEDLTDADFSGEYPYLGYHLDYADLRDANLGGAILKDTSLCNADLSNADLTGADLTGADLRGAALVGADLSRADLSRADLGGANFYYAKVDPHHVPLIEAAKRREIESLSVSGRTPNPRYGSRRGPRGY
jgi:hypothetical protein